MGDLCPRCGSPTCDEDCARRLPKAVERARSALLADDGDSVTDTARRVVEAINLPAIRAAAVGEPLTSGRWTGKSRDEVIAILEERLADAHRARAAVVEGERERRRKRDKSLRRLVIAVELMHPQERGAIGLNTEDVVAARAALDQDGESDE